MCRLRQARRNPKAWKQHTRQTRFKRESAKVMEKTVGDVKATSETLLETGGWRGSGEAFLPVRNKQESLLANYDLDSGSKLMRPPGRFLSFMIGRMGIHS